LPRKRRQTKIPTPAWEREHGTIGRRLLGLSPQAYATIAIVGLVVVALGVVFYAIAADEIADRNRPGSTALRIDDRKHSLDYFTNRVGTYIQQNGGQGVVTWENAGVAAIQAVQEELIEEHILQRFAGEQGQATTEDEINDEIATRMNINKEDPNFGTRFQEELTRSGLKEEEYRELAAAAVLRRKVNEKITAEIPPSAESVHYRLIALEGSDQAAADALRAQIEGGADFATLAKERSADTQTKENGGDAGWVPRGALDKELEDHLFAQEVNKVTTYPTANNIFVYQVVEKAADRPIEEAQKTQLGQKKFADWVTEKRDALDIQEFDLTNTDNLIYLRDRAWATS
jgi:parvulin-like peptidyl-prolyl isomerase